mmetsp:Transcript_3110/g.7239  ORF Transcript_3110/g.7239 Transcript_3110/m.7239 type:complete len:626 (-) Transcript_3110:135-2012(-)
MLSSNVWTIFSLYPVLLTASDSPPAIFADSGNVITVSAINPVTGPGARPESWASYTIGGLEVPVLFDAVGEALYTLCAFMAVGALGYARKRWRASRPSKEASPKAKDKLSSIYSKDAQEGSLQETTDVPQMASTPMRIRRTAETDMLASAVRAGKSASLPSLLDTARERVLAAGLTEDLEWQEAEHLLSALRACASLHCFREALTAYDHVSTRIGAGDATIWSLLLYSAVGAGDFRRCKDFFKKLCVLQAPSGQDFVNMVRYYSHRHDQKGLSVMLEELTQIGFKLEAVDRNRALAACTSNNAMDLAEILIRHEGFFVAMDTVAYNTIMKAHAQAGKPELCLAIFEQMQRSGLTPSEMSFGILLDACIDARHFDGAKEAFEKIRKCGLAPNVVHYTTLMKGLVNAGRLDDATDVLGEMLQSSTTKPDLVAFSTMVKAYSDRGSVRGAVRILEQMLGSGVTPDSIIFNIVLTGCCVRSMESSQVLHVLTWLVRHGLEPSTTTLSILMKALAKSESFEAAIQFLKDCPQRLNLTPESRIYAQLAQACSKAGYSQRALEVYEAMAEAVFQGEVNVDEPTNLRLNRLCNSCGFHTEAAELYAKIAACRRKTVRPSPRPTGMSIKEKKRS